MVFTAFAEPGGEASDINISLADQNTVSSTFGITSENYTTFNYGVWDAWPQLDLVGVIPSIEIFNAVIHHSPMDLVFALDDLEINSKGHPGTSPSSGGDWWDRLLDNLFDNFHIPGFGYNFDAPSNPVIPPSTDDPAGTPSYLRNPVVEWLMDSWMTVFTWALSSYGINLRTELLREGDAGHSFWWEN